MNATGSGRPRDPRIDADVLAATRALLLEVGFDQLSVRAVAGRAGVSRAAIARRWESKAQLVLDAVLGVTPDLTPFEGADRAGWIHWVVTGSSALFRQPEVREAVPGLLATLRDHDELRAALWRNFADPAAELFPGSSGSAAGDPDTARALLVLGAGAALFLSLIAPEEDTPEVRAKVLEILLPVADGSS
ncbi:TetR family transcriptional regulator [Rhodococcus sp. NPDC127528]|uniref:TetR/AcrR family transcriptional regulator n=1 Tax=unclassified Rhodococcus (in: high G+C Gram-positive bacteria) TaxID=192944 RepID=UPI003634C280